ncbi:MAG: ribulose-phosphate 3-epimerase [bacterium]|nr:ribulose-phosphate 3-epimerase [bacterium]
MRILPAVNCPSFHCVEERVALAAAFSAPWVHLDVADGKFSIVPTWNNPEEFEFLRSRFPDTKFQVHLMVQDPEAVLREWLDAGADEVVVHWEALRHQRLATRMPDAHIRIGICAATAIEDVIPFLGPAIPVLLLTVPPGLSGHTLDLSVVEKARALRERFPEISIEIDGGVTAHTIPIIRECADAATAGVAIFNSPDPARAYRDLCAA